MKLAIGLVATMSALVLGLLVSSAKGAYDTERSEVILMASKITFLGRVLAAYGPEAAGIRAQCRDAVDKSLHAGGAFSATIPLVSLYYGGFIDVDVVNPDAMRVRAKVNQADINDLAVSQAVRIGLDAYPDLHFPGKIVQISPLGVMSNLSNKVRAFVVLIAIEGSHPNLMPDLTASLDVELTPDERAYLEEPYTARPVVGF